MPSLVGGMSHRNAGSSGRNGRGRNKRTDKSSSSSTKGNGRAARSFAAVAGLVLCSVGLLGLSGNSDAGKLSSYFWGYARTQKRGAGLVARILLAAEKYEFKDESSGENATSVMSSSETEHSSVGERQMLKIDVSAGGGGSDGSGSEGADSSAAVVPSPSDLAAYAAPVYLDEVPQCSVLTASQCEDLLSAHPEILQEALRSRPTAGMTTGQMAESRYQSMQGAYGGTSSSGTAAATTNVFSSSDANGMASTTSSTSSTGESEYYRDVEHGAATNTENKAYIQFKDPIVQKAKERQITDEHYYKVVLVTDREKTKVVGPEGFGEVTYPFPWRYQGKQMSVGPWDCQPAGEVLSVKQCCDKIVNSVPCPDDLGNCMSCHIQPGYVQGKDRVITQPDTLNVDTYNEFHYDDSSSNGDMASSTVFGSNFNGPDFSSTSTSPQASSPSPIAPNQFQQQPRPTNVFPSYSGMPQASSNGVMPGNQYQQPSRYNAGTSNSHHVSGGWFDPMTGRYYSSTSIGNGKGMNFPVAGAGGSGTSSGSDGNSIHVLVEDGDDDEGGASGGPSAWTILTFVLLMLASFFIGFLVNYGLRRARKRRKRVIITDDPTNLNGGATIVPPGAVSIAPSVANADMDIESMGGGRYPISFQPRRRGSLGGNSVAYTARSAPVQYVFDDDSDDDEDIEVISTSGRSYFPPDMITDPPAHMYVDNQSNTQSRSYPRRMSGLSSSASKVMFSENNPYNESASSNLTSSFRTRSSTQPSTTIPEESDGRGEYSERDSERESEWADQSSVDTPARANSTRRVRRNSL